MRASLSCAQNEPFGIEGSRRVFFRWAVRRDWLARSPAEGLSPIRVTHTPTLPFSAEELARLLDQARADPILYAFVLLLRWTGVRISDAVALRWSAIEEGRLRLRTQKTGTAVHLPLVPALQEALEQVPRVRGIPTVFWPAGAATLEHAIARWRRRLAHLFRRADIDRVHPHRFRDTFAVDLLLKGVELADVSVLLGHASIRVTERHYAPWVPARQTRLDAAVVATWGTDGA